MTFTEQQKQDAVTMLTGKGFLDKQSEHPWNDIQMTKGSASETGLSVWGRRSCTGLILIWEGPEERFMDIIETDDVEILAAAVDHAERFIETIQALQGAAQLTAQ